MDDAVNKEYVPEHIEVRDAAGNVVSTILNPHDVPQCDGTKRARGISGVPYEVIKFSFDAQTIEQCEDFGRSAVLAQFKAHMGLILDDPTVIGIEWRMRPELRINEYHDHEATIVDRKTGAPRQGIELRQEISVRARMVVHKVKNNNG